MSEDPVLLELKRAIGSVAIASAELDDTLRFVLSKLTGSETMYFIQGLMTDVLVQALTTQLAETDPERTWLDAALCDQLSVEIKRISALQQYRNWFVHGVFLDVDWLFDSDDLTKEAKGRPYGDIDDGTHQFICQRSRSKRSQHEVRRFSIGDIDKVADGLQALKDTIEYLWSDVTQEKRRRDEESFQKWFGGSSAEAKQSRGVD